MSRLTLITIVSVFFLISPNPLHAEKAEPDQNLYDKDNLVAWCIVPFDSKKRNPFERAEMLTRLGISRVAYDWREEHIATFEEEILQYKKHNLEYFAFWSWHPAMEPLIQKYNIHPQIWITNPSPTAESQQDRIEAAAKTLLPLVEKTKQLDLKLGLYNHGGWGGQPANLVAVCQYLREHHQADQVGIIYNFHHGHQHLGNFADAFTVMLPYLHCVNINGMADPDRVAAGTDKILPVGSGTHEKEMLRLVQNSGYNGPIGILDHRSTVDAEISLHENLTGLEKIIPTLNAASE